MINNIDKCINQIVEFLNNIGNLNIDMSKEFLESVKLSTSFKKLQLLEKQHNFDEASSHCKFFRKGICGEWKKKLTNEQVKLIEDELADPMKQLNYL